MTTDNTRLISIVLDAMEVQLATKPEDRKSVIAREFVSIIRRENGRSGDEGATATGAMQMVLGMIIGSIAAAGEIGLAMKLLTSNQQQLDKIVAMGIADGLMHGRVAEPGDRAPEADAAATVRGKETLQ